MTELKTGCLNSNKTDDEYKLAKSNLKDTTKSGKKWKK